MENSKSLVLTLTHLLLASVALGAAQPEIWRDPTVFRINKEKAHAEFTIHADRADALKPLDLANPWRSNCYQSLNGEWDFNWYASVSAVPADWYQPDTKVAVWNHIPVPDVWQSHGFDRLYYLNTYMPFEFDWDTGERAKGFREDDIEESKATGYIPDSAQRVGCYRKWVELSEERLKSRVVLRIGAVEAGVQIFVNGAEVGYSQDSLTPAEFDISAHLKPGKNLIALKVFRWTDGSYMEVQDMVRWAGIYRDVFLRFEPEQRIRDIRLTGTPDETLKTIDTTYAVAVVNSSPNPLKGAKLEFELLPDGATEPVKTWSKTIDPLAPGAEVDVAGALELNDLKLWSPDLPNLYTLIASLVDANGGVLQVARIDAGFRRFENIDGNLFLNGKRYHIRGVNRHDHHPTHGRHVPLENMIRDLELMKQNNINTVRACHYPNDERWLYLCNRYGMALIDEANVESHGFEDVPGNRPQWLAAAVDRVENMVRRDINNPAVFIWSLGNEQGWGWTRAFEAQYTRVKEIDPSRLVMCDRANRQSKDEIYNSAPLLDKPDTVTPMYRAVENMTKYLGSREQDKRPFFMCEYRHAMGEAVGALKEVWDLVYANEENGLNGGCIWDWIDQGVAARAPDGTVYYQYGGDWGDKTSANNFCLNGLVLPDQGWTPKLPEVKKCYEPFTMTAVSPGKGIFEVLNRLNQLGMDAFEAKWQLRENGTVVQEGTLDTLHAKPREKQTFTVPFDTAAITAGKEYILRIGFERKEATIWAPKGHEVTFSEFKLQGSPVFETDNAGPAPAVSRDGGNVVIETANGVAVTFAEATGLLTSFKIKGSELLAHSDRDRLFDHSMAWIDNLFSWKNKSIRLPAYNKLALADLSPKGRADVSVATQDSSVVVTVKNSFMSPKNAGFDEVQTWTIHGSGVVEVAESVAPAGKLDSNDWVARIGLRIPLKPELNEMSYYGLGPQGNWPDRCYGAWTAIHTSTVAANYTPYPRPQDCGNHEQVRWMTLSDANGNGLKIIAPEPLSMGALPYTQDELSAASHTIDLPKSPTTTELRIAAKVTGIGNGSCGPLTDEEYRPKAALTQYRFLLVPISKGN